MRSRTSAAHRHPLHSGADRNGRQSARFCPATTSRPRAGRPDGHYLLRHPSARDPIPIFIGANRNPAPSFAEDTLGRTRTRTRSAPASTRSARSMRACAPTRVS
jgi:hypothetical protein